MDTEDGRIRAGRLPEVQIPLLESPAAPRRHDPNIYRSEVTVVNRKATKPGHNYAKI